MLRALLASLAAVVCLTPVARPAAPPLPPRISLEEQLEAIDLFGGIYELAGSGRGRYVVALDLRFAPDWKKDTPRHLSVFDRLQRLEFRGRELDDADLEHVARLRSLRSLDLSNNEKITDEATRRLATLPLLESLDLTDTKVGDAGSVHLGGMRSLKCLKHQYISDAGLAALARCRTLESLEFKDGEISEKGARAFASMRGLRHLSMGSCKLAPGGQLHLRHLTGLKSLHVFWVELTDAGLEAAVGLPALEEFYFWTGAYDAALPKVGGMRAIKRIGSPDGDRFLEAVSRCKTVESIMARGDESTDAGVAHLVRLPALRKLDLDRSSVTDLGVAFLARCPALRELFLPQTKVTDACIPSLIKMKSLRKVDLRYTKVSKKGCERLRQARPDLEVEIFAYWKKSPDN